MAHLGDFDATTVVYGKFTTYRPSTGASFTLAGTPALSVYKDNSTTQSTTGVTLTADFDSVTGFNHFAIDTSADGTFYAAGSFFDVVITTGTVDSVSVTGSVVGSFTLRKNSALKPTTAARTLDVSAGGEAGLDWANIGSPTTAVNLSGTNIDVDQVVASVSGAVASVTGAVGSVTGLTAATVHADLDDIQTRLPAALVSGRMDASVGAMAANTLTATAINADAITAAKLAADVTTELQSGLATAAALATVDGIVDALLVTSDKLDDTLEDDAGTYRFTINALEQAPSGSGASASAIADEVQTRTIAAVTVVNGLAANVITAAATAADFTTEIQSGLATAAALTTVDDFLDTEITAIKAKTDSLTFTVSGKVDANITHVRAAEIIENGSGTTNWGSA
jgi:hypothetical protein